MSYRRVAKSSEDEYKVSSDGEVQKLFKAKIKRIRTIINQLKNTIKVNWTKSKVPLKYL